MAGYPYNPNGPHWQWGPAGVLGPTGAASTITGPTGAVVTGPTGYTGPSITGATGVTGVTGQAGAGGPISPSSIYLGGASGNLFPNYYAGGGGNVSATEEGIGVVASLGADAVAQLRFPMPPKIPNGQLKLMVRMMANASTGNVLFTVSDGSCGTGASPSAVSLTGETQSTATIVAADQYLDKKVSLTTTPSANDDLIVAITFNHTSWTLAVVLTCLVWVLWE